MLDLKVAVAAFHTPEYEEIFSDLGMDLDSMKEAIAFAGGCMCTDCAQGIAWLHTLST